MQKIVSHKHSYAEKKYPMVAAAFDCFESEPSELGFLVAVLIDHSIGAILAMNFLLVEHS